MSAAEPLPSQAARDRYSTAQLRTIDAAMGLFADHGVSGTSFQNIADVLGVTKAAVYHQFKTKDSLVLAVAEVGLAPLEDALLEAERAPTLTEARTVMLHRVIDLAIERRRWVNAMQGDPVMIRLLGEHDPFVDLMTRVYGLLLGLDDSPTAMVRTAIVSASIGAAIAHPVVADLDDETLRHELLLVTGKLFEID